MKTVERGTSPMKLIAPCGGYEDLPFNAGSGCPSPQPSVQEHSYCPYHNRGQVSTMMGSSFCCTPTTKCNECKCHETCVTHGSSCPYGSDNPFRSRSSARVDPDPLK
ncbi:unnamed protein product [Arctia plantaginis]|nr:unnamed protein product [Arctia plantaginis]